MQSEIDRKKWEIEEQNTRFEDRRKLVMEQEQMFLNKQKETEELTLQQQIISDQTKELEHRLEESKSGENNALMYQSFTSNSSNSTLSEKNTQNLLMSKNSFESKSSNTTLNDSNNISGLNEINQSSNPLFYRIRESSKPLDESNYLKKSNADIYVAWNDSDKSIQYSQIEDKS